MSLVLNLSMDLYSVNMKKIGLTASVLCLSLSAQAERIEFTNGDRLEVEITQQTETTLSFTHPIFGEQSIDKSQISNYFPKNIEQGKIIINPITHDSTKYLRRFNS